MRGPVLFACAAFLLSCAESVRAEPPAQAHCEPGTDASCNQLGVTVEEPPSYTRTGGGRVPALPPRRPPHFNGPLEKSTDRPGRDFSHFGIQPNPLACQTACDNNNSCQAWTYVKPGIQGPSAMCWLKKPAPAPHPSPCCVSGVVDRP